MNQLHAAAKGGSTKVVQALLEAGSGPDVNRPKLSGNQEYPLHIAAKLGHVGVSMALIEAGADVSCRDRNGWSPLHLAARFGQIEVRGWLLQMPCSCWLEIVWVIDWVIGRWIGSLAVVLVAATVALH